MNDVQMTHAQRNVQYYPTPAGAAGHQSSAALAQDCIRPIGNKLKPFAGKPLELNRRIHNINKEILDQQLDNSWEHPIHRLSAVRLFQSVRAGSRGLTFNN